MWNQFFTEKQDVVIDDKRTFCIYRTKEPEKPGPVLLLLHGGGYSGLTWALFCVGIFMAILKNCFHEQTLFFLILHSLKSRP